MKQLAFCSVLVAALAVFNAALAVHLYALSGRQSDDLTRIEKLEATIACLRHGPMQPGQSGCFR